jgi:glyoxylase-like metal-dependent hydrolase (beta-lactamase superfamily II)
MSIHSYSQNVFSFKTGGVEVVMLADVTGTGDASILIDASPEILQNAIPDGTYENSVSAFLLKTPSQNILIDTGLGQKLSENLRSARLSVADIDAILLTHLHGDHIGGLLDGDKLVFPNAEIYIATPEYDYWNNPTLADTIAGSRRAGVLNVQKMLKLYEANIKQFNPTEISDAFYPLLPNVQDIAAFGHTPGHTAYLINLGNRKLLIWGDVMHAMQVQMPYPDISVTYDVDPQKAAETRKRLLEYVSKNKIPVAGMHLPFPKIGFVRKNPNVQGGYTFVPIEK